MSTTPNRGSGRLLLGRGGRERPSRRAAIAENGSYCRPSSLVAKGGDTPLNRPVAQARGLRYFSTQAGSTRTHPTSPGRRKRPLPHSPSARNPVKLRHPVPKHLGKRPPVRSSSRNDFTWTRLGLEVRRSW